MKFGSVCSGIEAASQAWHPLGWKAAWLSEIEPFPCAVLAHHYPETPNLGDMNKFESWPDDEQHAIDLLCGGTPCQSFSIAGLRKGLDDARGNLMLTFAAIAAKYRPQWLVWENVPGVLSSNEGRDFASFLGLLSGQVIEPPKEGWGNSGIITGYKNAYSLAYRVLDAQYFGVAQRRRRVFVVGCLGDSRRAAAVLFERHSLQGDSAPSRETREGTTRGIEIGPSGGCFTDVNPTLDAGCKDGPVRNQLAGCVGTLCIATGQGGAEIGAEIGADISPTLNCNHEAPILAFDTTQITSAQNVSNPKYGDPCHPLAAQAHVPAIAYGIAGGGGDKAHVLASMQVRRLMPIECERLQGFPDNYTQVPHRGKPAADGPRYKALGNSWAVPNVYWIGERIQMVDELFGGATA
jgi:DNA (cytosine-5)-methyltransferase 1